VASGSAALTIFEAHPTHTSLAEPELRLGQALY